jgi:hypothetical protein
MKAKWPALGIRINSFLGAVELHFTTGMDVGLLSRGSGQLVQMSLY